MYSAHFAQFSRAGLLVEIDNTVTGKVCNECKTFGQLVNWDMLGHKCSFPNSHFLGSGRKK